MSFDRAFLSPLLLCYICCMTVVFINLLWRLVRLPSVIIQVPRRTAVSLQHNTEDLKREKCCHLTRETLKARRSEVKSLASETGRLLRKLLLKLALWGQTVAYLSSLPLMTELMQSAQCHSFGLGCGPAELLPSGCCFYQQGWLVVFLPKYVIIIVTSQLRL